MKPPEKQNKPCSHKGGILYFRGKRCQAHTHNDLWVVHSFRGHMCTWTRDVWWLIVGLIVDVVWVAPPQVRPHKQFLFLEVFQRSEIEKPNDYQHGCFKFPHTHTYHPLKTNKPGKMNHHEPSWTPFIKSKSDGQLLDLSGLAILEFQTSRWSLPPRCGSIPGAMGEVGCWIPIAESTQKSKTDV